MAATTMESQLKALKSLVKADTDVPRRPITRPSVLFDPKQAADLDIDTILDIALSGFEVLVNIDERFINHKSDLFSHKSRAVDRELMTIEENNRINASISSYLRLLSGHLQLPSAFKTIEYLVRRYKIHVYNIEELVLCALPYHDTHAFVRIVQLIDFGNTRWKFLDGVKASGAPPPRTVFVQQCERDMGVIEIICNYATPTKKHHPSTPVISFCTALVVEVLGSLSIVDSEIVKRILPFLNSGLQSGGKGSSDYKAGTLMIVGLLAKRVALSPKLVSSLVRSVAELARADTQACTDLHWAQMSITALINIVQLQYVETLPKKAVDNLIEISDLPGILSQLTGRFNIDKFLTLLLESLIDYSSSDSHCKLALLSILETVSIEGLIRGVVCRLLSSCLRLSQQGDGSDLSESGSWAKKILLLLNKKYASELRVAVHEFLEDKQVRKKGDVSVVDALCKMLDGNLKASLSDSRMWFALEHPNAEVRRATLSTLDLSTALNDGVNSQRLVTAKDAVAQCLSDDDLNVVLAALSVDKLSQLIDCAHLLKNFQILLRRCTEVLLSGPSKDLHLLASKVAVSCLKHGVFILQNQSDLVEEIASMILPFLLVFPKTEMLNLKAQEFAKEIKWPFYRNLICSSDIKMDVEKKTRQECLCAANKAIVRSLVDAFSTNGKEFMLWLIKCSGDSKLSKTISLLVLLHPLSMQKIASHRLPISIEDYFSFLKTEWRALELEGDILSGSEFTTGILDAESIESMELLWGFSHKSLKELNARILILLFWRSLKAYISSVALDDDGNRMGTLRDLYIFFAESNLKHLFKEHRHHLVQNCNVSSIHFLSSFITEPGVSSTVQVESLHSFALLCSQADEAFAVHLLAGFPLILVPLSSEIQDVRTSAMKYVEELCTLCSRVKYGGKKNGNNESWSSFIDELLTLVVEQKKLILSDQTFLPSFLASILSSSFRSLVVPQDVGQRFKKPAVDCILAFILGSAMKLSGYGKLKILSLVKDLGGLIARVKDVEHLLRELLKHRLGYHVRHDKSFQKLSSIDVDILCLLIDICSMPNSSDAHIFEDLILPSMWVDGMVLEDPAVVRPCVTLLQKLNGNLYKSLSVEMQQKLFTHLVVLYHDANIDVQNATRNALLQLDISSSTISHTLDSILTLKIDLVCSSSRKKKKSDDQNLDMFFRGQNALMCLSSFLDVLLLKKDMENRTHIIGPLFKLVRKAFSNEWVQAVSQEVWVKASGGVSQTMSSTLCYIQHTVLLILQDIIASLSSSGLLDEVDTPLLVDCARSAFDVVSRNHVYSLFATIAKVAPQKVLSHIPEIFAVIGESTVSQSDTHSRRVFEDFISSVVPCWLSNMGDADKLLRIFLNVMPHVAPYRRLSIVLHLLKTLGERSSLGSLLVLLFRSLVSKDTYSAFDDEMKWEYDFAAQLCEQYSCMIWLPSLVSVVKQLQRDVCDRELFLALVFALRFIQEKMQDAEFVFKLHSMEDMETIQGTLCELMVQVIICWQLFDLNKKTTSLPIGLKKELKELVHSVLIKTTKGMLPAPFFQGIIRVLTQDEKDARKKALQVLCERVREVDVLVSKKDKGPNVHLTSRWHRLEGSDLDSYGALCLEILQLLDGAYSDQSNVSIRLAAISALEVLASKFPSNHAIFSKCLASVVKNVACDDLSVSSRCLRTTGSLINVLGPRALPELPHIMKNVLKRTLKVPNSKDSVMLSTLVTLEALVENLGAFLNPYLGDIVELLVLNSDYISESNQKLKSKADSVRKLLSEKVPLRLALPVIQNVYTKAVNAGDLSISTVFELLENFVGKLEKTLVKDYHAIIFDFCMLGLDLRSQRVASIKNVNLVERHVISAIITLTMKMSEIMFKPVFIRSIEWADSTFDNDNTGSKNVGRAVSFYGLLNMLAEKHRSIFVPYYKYLLDGCVRYLTDEDAKGVAHSRKKKKTKLQSAESGIEANDAFSLEKWHLRALVVSSLHKCFLYDTGSLKFLDSSKFELLLKPIVSQLVVEPPTSLDEHPDTPSVSEVDDALVSCLGQMAVTAGSDLLWKPLNYEVLMQTRSEAVRSRLLGLRVVKRLVENLKEEYLALLAETIPFLAELLEDVELPVKALAQEILKELESMSGENLRDYF